MHKIFGDVLVGFGDFFSGIGATATRGKTSPVPPAGKKGTPPLKPYPKPPRRSTMENHGKVMTQAHGVATKALAVMANAMRVLANKPLINPAHGPAGASASRIQGRRVQIGAAVAAALTSKQKAAVDKHNAAVQKAAKAKQVLAQRTVATRKTLAELAKKMVAQKKVATLLRTPLRRRGATRVGQLLNDPVIGQAVASALGEYYTAVGADPDPNNPGFLTDGTPDPAFADPTAGMDLGPVSDPLDSATLPPPPSMDTFIPDMTAVGGIAYDGSKGAPEGYVGSYGMFTRQTDSEAAAGGKWVWPIDWMNHYGYVFGKYDRDMNGGFAGGDETASGKWNEFHGGKGRGDWASNPDPSEAFASNSKLSPDGKKYGPLVGNPFYKDFAAMRVDGQGNMFWLPQEAPDWLTFPIKQAAALTAQAAQKAAADAAAADAAAQAKAAADAAAAQAAQDAANALAESQATSQANVAQTQAESQAQQGLVQQQQADTAQQAADTAQQQIETQQMQQAGDLMLAQARRADAYYAQHPEEEFAPPPPDAETYDDGSPVDGGDVMLDADGEGYVEPEDDGGSEG